MIDSVLKAQEEAEDRRLLDNAKQVRLNGEEYSCIEDNETTPWLKQTG
jgi:hypothetical protein